MNDRLLDSLANPVFDLEEAGERLRMAGHEIMRLEERVQYLKAQNMQLRDHIERLALDLGLKEYLQSINIH